MVSKTPPVLPHYSVAMLDSTLVSAAGEDGGEVLEGLADPLVLLWQRCVGARTKP